MVQKAMAINMVQYLPSLIIEPGKEVELAWRLITKCMSTRTILHSKTVVMATNLVIGNSADYGGAVYMADEVNSVTCTSIPHRLHSTTSECFF